MEIITGIEQGTEEWLALRAGFVTSSCFDKVMSKGMGNAPSKTRESYMHDLAFERLSGKPAPDGFKSTWMDRGNEIEAQARAMYELENGVEVQQVTFIKLDDDIGASTDGLVSDGRGALELKCPKHNTHIKYLLDPALMETEYRKQVQGEIWVSGMEYVDLCSFHPDFPPGKNLLIRRVLRDNKTIAEMKTAVDAFVIELKDMVKKLEAMYG